MGPSGGCQEQSSGAIDGATPWVVADTGCEGPSERFGFCQHSSSLFVPSHIWLQNRPAGPFIWFYCKGHVGLAIAVPKWWGSISA